MFSHHGCWAHFWDNPNGTRPAQPPKSYTPASGFHRMSQLLAASASGIIQCQRFHCLLPFAVTYTFSWHTLPCRGRTGNGLCNRIVVAVPAACRWDSVPKVIMKNVRGSEIMKIAFILPDGTRSVSILIPMRLPIGIDQRHTL